jgi:replicative DNA helicase
MKTTEIFAEIEKGKGTLEFMPTGIKDVDILLDGGFLREELVVIGGFTGIGKSYLAGQIMFTIARSGFKTAYISLEISNKMVVSRLLGQEADIKSIKILTGDLTKEEHKNKLKAEAIITGYDEIMDYYDNLYTIEEIANLIRNNDFEFVVIDFIQNIMAKNMDEYTRISYISLELQKLAKEKHCCILLLSQLSNTVAKNIDGTQLEYKGSGSIATVCDLGFFLERDFEMKIMKLSLRKNRRGMSGQAIQLFLTGNGGKIQ